MTNDPTFSCGHRSAERYVGLYDQAARLAKIGAWECDLVTEQLTWTDGVYELFELPRASTLYRASMLDLYDAESRPQMERLRAGILQRGGSFTLDARIHTAHGASRWMRLTAEAVHEHGRPARLYGAKQDITHEKQLWDNLRQLAEEDSLTGLANRRVFEARCSELARSAADDGAMAVLALVDLDRFKDINDRLGHAAGDECLRQIAARLHWACSDAVVIARIGGDEFAVLLQARLGRPQIAYMLERALRVLGRPVLWQNAHIALGASIGVSVLKRPHFQGVSQLFAEADAALYVAKAAGRNTIRVFAEELESADYHQPAAVA